MCLTDHFSEQCACKLSLRFAQIVEVFRYGQRPPNPEMTKEQTPPPPETPMDIVENSSDQPPPTLPHTPITPKILKKQPKNTKISELMQKFVEKRSSPQPMKRKENASSLQQIPNLQNLQQKSMKPKLRN